MVGFLSFLIMLCAIAFLVALVLLVVRIVKKKPRKPFVIMAAVSCMLFFVFGFVVAEIYEPSEKLDPTPTEAPEPEESAIPTETSEPVHTNPALTEAPTPEPTASPVPTEAPTPEPTASPAPTKAPTPEPTASPAPTKAPTPEPTASPVPTETPSSDSSVENEDFIETHQMDIVVASKMILDNFINNYKIPLATQLWTIAKFDEEGAIAAMADVTEKSTKSSESAIVVFTPIMEGDRMTGATPHYVSIGDVVYGDDGYCDDFFSLLEEILGSLVNK